MADVILADKKVPNELFFAHFDGADFVQSLSDIES